MARFFLILMAFSAIHLIDGPLGDLTLIKVPSKVSHRQTCENRENQPKKEPYLVIQQ
jgi:hypothetical protein